jgi:site-specific DNA recombinase
MRKAGVYLRISMDRLGKEAGIERQRADGTGMCAELDLEPLFYTDNDLTASKTRPADSDYERMLADARAGRLAAVVVADLDRLVRLPREIEDWIDLAEGKAGPVAVRLVTLDGEVDAGTENGRMFLRIKAAVARAEAERLGARRKRALEQRAAHGIPHWTSVFGYRTVGEKLDRKVVVEPAEAAALQKAMADVVSGKVGLAQAARDLNDAGWVTSTGYPWMYQTLRKHLTAIRYTGVNERHGAPLATAWTPLWDEEQRQRAVLLLDDPERRKSLDNRPKHLLTGIATCWKCEGVVHYGQVTLLDGTRTPVYRCVPGCVARHMSLADHVITLKVLAHMQNAEHPSTDATPDRALIQAEADVLKLRRNSLVRMLTRGDLPPEDAEPQIAALRARLDELEASISTPADVAPFRRWLNATDAWDSMSLVQRRALLRAELVLARFDFMGRGPKATVERPGMTILWRTST